MSEMGRWPQRTLPRTLCVCTDRGMPQGTGWYVRARECGGIPHMFYVNRKHKLSYE